MTFGAVHILLIWKIFPISILSLHDQADWLYKGRILVSGMNKNPYKTVQPAWRDEIYSTAHLQIQINKELNLFLSCDYEHMSRQAR